MSEYQYYEFQAIDKPLDNRAISYLHSLSSRAEITSTSFTNTYNYGDFRGKPGDLMEKYFDAFVYIANWGTHQFMLRLPRRLFDVEVARAYCAGESFTLKSKGEHVVLEFLSQEEEGGDWEEGEGWLTSLMALREDLMNGDLRSLYLGWLSGIQFAEPDDDTPEPPVPPGLRKLSGPLKRLVEFLRIDPDLVKVAAQASTSEVVTGPAREELAAWIGKLPVTEKNALLLRLAEEDGPGPRREFLQQFQQAWAEAHPRKKISTGPVRRTVGQLITGQGTQAEESQRKEAERQAKERARQEREEAEARTRRLDALAPREEEAWRQVESLIQTKNQKNYDQAVELLKDLRDLGERGGRKAAVATRIRQLRERHSSKSSFKRRLDTAGLE